MKTQRNLFHLFIFTAALAAAPLFAQNNQRPAAPPARGGQPADGATGDYASDIVVVSDAQQQALDQAKQALTQGTGAGDHATLDTAIKEMERAQAALAAAKKTPDQLPAAIAAEQSAYQALLKATPREYRMARARNQGQNQRQGGSAGQPDQQQMDQLDMPEEQNRYETERQAAAQPNAQQREQTQVADRLKELAQRQQDLNDRMRELQTALQAARTDREREDLQAQLKRLDEEQRQTLASVDELRQQLEQSPNASAESTARQQLDQTRADMQRASEALQNQSASQALAAGTRAQENMQNLRDDLRRQTSSQFSEQMRQMRSEARDMTNRENEIARNLDALDNDGSHPLDDAAQRQQISNQMAAQESAVTNLLAGMKDVTEQAETTEPLLSKQLYDTLRRADQMHTENQLELGAELVNRGFLPQASEVERSARTNITELAESVQRAADSVLGSQADALRYAQRELDDLTRQLQREIGADTNAGTAAGGPRGAPDQTNRLARAAGKNNGRQGTNAASGNDVLNRLRQQRQQETASGTNGNAPGGETQMAGNNPQARRPGQGNGREGNTPQGNQNGNRGQNGNQGAPSEGAGNNGQPDAAGNQQAEAGSNGRPDAAGNPPTGRGQTVAGNNGGRNPGRGQRGGGNQPGGGDNNNAPDQTPGSNPGQGGETARNGGNENGGGPGAGGAGDTDRLRQFTEQLGRGGRAANGGPDNVPTGNDGPITGTNYSAWTDQLRNVENVVESADLRNQLAVVQDRMGAYRRGYRDFQRIPTGETIRQQLLLPLGQVRVWVQEELAREEKTDSLVPLDRDPVPENYSKLVSQYYEKLGSAK